MPSFALCSLPFVRSPAYSNPYSEFCKSLFAPTVYWRRLLLPTAHELEKETGAVSIGPSKLPRGMTPWLNVDPRRSRPLTVRSSGLTKLPEDGRKYPPNFAISAYKGALRMRRKEAQIGYVVFLSKEHDDTTEFKRLVFLTTLPHVIRRSAALSQLRRTLRLQKHSMRAT